MSVIAKIIAVFLLILAVALSIFAYRLATAPEVVSVELAPPAASVAPTLPVKVPTYDVVIARRDLAPGDVLTPDALELVQWPVRPATAFANVTPLEGRVLRLPVAKGEPVTQAWLAHGLATYLHTGERALSIPVDEVVGAGNRITPGDKVDVFFTLNKDRDQIGATQARLLLAGVSVLAYGEQSIDGPGEGAAQNQGSTRGASSAKAPRTAILAVPLEVVNELLLAERSGKLQLVLRAPDDIGTPDRSLFPARESVLGGRASLTPVQREALKESANQAYAGASLPDLSALNQTDKQITPPPVSAAAPQRRTADGGEGRRLQLIRGSQVQTVPY